MDRDDTGCSGRSRSRRPPRAPRGRPGRARPCPAPSKTSASTSSSCRRPTNHSWKRERPGGRDDVRAQRVVGRRAARRVARPAALAEARGDRRERLSGAERLRAHEMEAEVEVAEHEPALPAPRASPTRAPARSRPARPQPRSVVVQPGERVEDRVEVGRDVQPEHLDVVADVADHRQLARREDVVQAARELRAADAAGEEDDVHRQARVTTAVRQHGARARGRRARPVARGRRACRRRPRARGSRRSRSLRAARNRAALPGP